MDLNSGDLGSFLEIVFVEPSSQRRSHGRVSPVTKVSPFLRALHKQS
jgi:hypothetical protein